MTAHFRETFVAAVERLLRDSEERALLAAAARADAARHSLAGMVDRFCDGIEAALASPRLRGSRRREH